MNKRTLLYLVSLTLGLTLSALSAHSVMAEPPQEDSQRSEQRWLNALNKANTYPDNDPRKCETMYGLYRYYNNRGDYEKAIAVLKPFIEMRKRHPEDRFFYLLSWHQCELADLYYHLHKWSNAITEYKAALSAWEQTRHWLSMIPAYDKLGNCYFHLNNVPSTSKSYQQALTAVEKAQHLPGLERQVYLIDVFKANVLEDNGFMLESCGRKPEGRKLRDQSAAIWTQLNHHFGATTSSTAKSDTLERIAAYYCHMGKYVESEIIYDMVLDFSDSLSARQALLPKISRLQVACRKEVPPSYLQPLVGKSGAQIKNTFLQEFSHLKTRQDFYCEKSGLVSKYAYAVPTAEALEVFKQYQPIVEIGAGTGYWTFLMREMGIKAIAFERYPVSAGNEWFPGAKKSWTEVLAGDDLAAIKYPHHTLFLCWPPGRYPVAYNALRTFKGNYVIHVGSIGYGVNEDNFQKLLAKDWQLVKQVEMPQWIGDYEALFVYKRKHPL